MTTQLVIASQTGDMNAFTEIVRLYQNRCLATAISRTGHIEAARDVVQEAFLIAWRKIETLDEPDAFASWLRTIVIRRCARHSSKPTVPFEDEIVGGSETERTVQASQESALLTEAIADLSPLRRELVLLHYFDEATQAEIANLSGLSKTTVNNHLYAARQHLKGRLFEMAKDTFEDIRFSDESADRIAEIISVHGSLVEARADDLGVLDTLGSGNATMFVVQRAEDGTLLCVSSPGVSAKDPIQMRESVDAFRGVAEEQIEEVVRKISSPRDNVVLETGIKAVDIFAPVARGGSVGVFGGAGVGRAVFANEMVLRQARFAGHADLFFYVGYFDLLGTKELVASETLFSKDKHANISTAWIAHPSAGDPVYANDATYLDSRLYFSPALAVRGIWPAIDPLRSSSELMRLEIVGERHFTLAHRALDTVRDAERMVPQAEFYRELALGARPQARIAWDETWRKAFDAADSEKRTVLKRAEFVSSFLKQPFFCAEDFTGRQGSHVSLADALDQLEMILNDEFDDREITDLNWGEWSQS